MGVVGDGVEPPSPPAGDPAATSAVPGGAAAELDEAVERLLGGEADEASDEEEAAPGGGADGRDLAAACSSGRRVLEPPRCPEGARDGPAAETDGPEELQGLLEQEAGRRPSSGRDGSAGAPLRCREGALDGPVAETDGPEELQGLLEQEAGRPGGGPGAGRAASFTQDQKSMALKRTGVGMAGAVAFGGVYLAATRSTEGTWNFFACYLLELSLSADNAFAFYLVFEYFKTPKTNIHRCLFWGWFTAMASRLLLLFVFGQSLYKYKWLVLTLVPIMVYQGYRTMCDPSDAEPGTDNVRIVQLAKRCVPVVDSYHGDRFFVEQHTTGRCLTLTPLALTLAAVEVVDVIFAVDSMPAQFGITSDKFIIFCAVSFALMCLRSLFVVLVHLVDEMPSLRFYMGAILLLVGFRLTLEVLDMSIPPLVSLCALVGTIAGGAASSMAGGYLSDEEEAHRGCSAQEDSGDDDEAL